MKRMFLALTCLALVLLGALIASTSLGVAQTSVPRHDPRPSPTPDGLGPAAAPASPDVASLPDLVVTSIQVQPAIPVMNEEVTIRVTIKNQGTADVPLSPSPQNFYTDLYVDPAVVPIHLFQDGQISWGCQAYWLPAGDSHTLAATYVFTSVRTYALYVQVDTDNQVAPEQNENNNVFGPVAVQVVGPNVLLQQTHEDFQMGVASGLDISHPDGVMRRGIFFEPYTDPEVYYPDSQVDHPPLPPSNPANNVEQINPALTGNGYGVLYAAWEDGRNGGVFNRDIYFTRSTDGGTTWLPNDIRVNDDDPLPSTANQNKPDLAYDPTRNRVYAVWQDERNGDSDIYFAYSNNGGDTWSPNQLLSIDPPTSLAADQSNPSITVGPDSLHSIYVVWQDRRNNNDDIYLTRSDDGGLTWGNNYFVTDDPQMTEQDQVAPSVGVGLGSPPYFGSEHDDVFVCWEDWRDPDHPEIYVARSLDRGATFGIDTPVSLPAKESYRIEPTMEVSTSIDIAYVFDPVLSDTVPVLSPITAILVAWQQNPGDEADIYWAYATFVYEQPEPCPYPYKFCFKSTQQLSGFVIDSDYALPPDTGTTYPLEPSWQGQVAMARAFANDLTQCHADSTITYTKGVFVAWSDARSFDDGRIEIHTRRIASPQGEGTSFEMCEDQATGVLNDNAKIYALRDKELDGIDVIDYPVYEDFKPAATKQLNSYLFAEEPPRPSPGDPWSHHLWVVWDDDRNNDPRQTGTVQDRDVFAARWGLYPGETYIAYPEGTYISPVFDSRTLATWYVLSWWGVTEHYADLLMQTRFGDNPYAPREDVEEGGWTRWTGNPSSSYLGCSVGEGCYYDAPGRNIVAPDGTEFPQSRYIQYKVIIRGYDRLTALSQVKIYYKGVNTVYLPLVVRNH
jgi:hypothetical protein